MFDPQKIYGLNDRNKPGDLIAKNRTESSDFTASQATDVNLWTD